MLNTKEIKRQIKVVRSHSINEYRETIQLLRLLKKRAKTKDDRAFIRHQSVDIIKITVVVLIGALPGGTLVVAFIEMGFRKMDRTILPTSFRDDIHKKADVQDKSGELNVTP